MRHTDSVRRETSLPRVGIGVLWQHSVPETTVCQAGICLVLQGTKQMLVGGSVVRYGAGDCFASLIELPATCCIIETSDEKPFVATSLTIDPAAFEDLLGDLPPVPSSGPASAYGVASASRNLLEAWDGYLSLLDSPEDIPFLGATRERELLYRLLQSDHGPMLRHMARDESRLSRIRRVIDRIRHHFDEPLPVGSLAEMAGMSVASFHRHFKAVTAMSPLQYQKVMRLQAARRLLTNNVEAVSTAYAVGYESASQFSREYSRLFGRPPRQDATQLRGSIGDLSHLLGNLAHSEKRLLQKAGTLPS